MTQSSSEPGGGLSIRIRGASSVNASNEPLYVIDGFPIDNSPNLSSSDGTASVATNLSPRNPLNSLNPNDIESIEILKDASATAIYGSRGANGVVLITTKKGTKEKMSVNYNAYVGTQSVDKEMDILSTSEYINYINGVSQDQGNSPVFSSADIAAIGEGTDWQSQVYRDAPITDHNLSISGGTQNTSIYASLNYFNQQGIVKASGIQKYIGRLNVETKIGDFNFEVTHESRIWAKALDSLWVANNLEVSIPPYLPDTDLVKKDVRRLYSNIKEMDAQVGEILQQLKEDGLLEKTIIVWYSDHGGPLPRQKRLLYDSGLKVPMIIRFPNQQFAGQRDDQLISFIDFAPTTLSLAGIEPKLMGIRQSYRS
ncbi:MAG: sulfatase-like hydrolase/transferase [Bacteroidota bacterium]